MTYILIFIGIVLLFKVSAFAIFYFEKQYVRNDLEPHEYVSAEWKSGYVDARMEAARELGLSFCGSYVTAPHGSFMKGPTIFFRSPCGRFIVAILWANFFGLKVKKTELCSRFADGTAIITTDGIAQADPSGSIDSEIAYDADLPELLRVHERRLDGRSDVVAVSADALAYYEEIQMERARRMVSKGLARWVDPAETRLRLTLRGTSATAKANKRVQRSVVQAQTKKMAPAREPAGLTAQQDRFLGSAIEEHNRNNQVLVEQWGFGDYEEWGFDQKSGLFFIRCRDGSRVEAAGQIYGSYSAEHGTWEWAWNNPMIEDSISADSRNVKHYGEQEGLDYLTAGIVPVPDEKAAVYFGAVGEKINGAQGVFSGDSGPVKVFIGLKNLRRLGQEESV